MRFFGWFGGEVEFGGCVSGEGESIDLCLIDCWLLVIEIFEY